MPALTPERPVGVIGAGVMGSGIAQVAASNGFSVLLFDSNEKTAASGLSNIEKSLDRLADKGRLAGEEKSKILSRITLCGELGEIGAAGLVIEAVVEDLGVKKRLFSELEKITGPDTLLASNTSSLSITEIGSALKNPGRLLGMHFFNPAPVMKLVEVVTGLQTSPAARDTVRETALAWGKQPVIARSTPGFIVNRIARPYYAEALRVLQEGGGSPPTLDAILRESGGFKMGPFELMDLIGNDVNYAVSLSVFNGYYQDPRFTPSLLQKEMVEAGWLGRKSGRGFYFYDAPEKNGEPATEPPAPAPKRVTVCGRAGPLAKLLPALEAAGVSAREQGGGTDEACLELDGRIRLALTDGRSATQRTAQEGGPFALLDLARDYAACPRLALACGEQVSGEDRALAVGLLQKLGKKVSPLADLPGMLVMRTVCMLANEAANAVYQGVCSEEDADIAMQKGVNYPAGPLAWGADLGFSSVIAVLKNLGGTYDGGRYRVSPWLYRKHFPEGQDHE